MARNRFLLGGLIVALVFGCMLIAGGSLIYRIGFSNGFGQGAVIASSSGGSGSVVPPAYSPYGYGGYGGWGYGPNRGFSVFPILGLCLFGLFFWFVVGGIFRARMWRHRYGPWGGPFGHRHGWHGKGPWNHEGPWNQEGPWGRGPWGDQPRPDQPPSGETPQSGPSNQATL